MEDYHKRKPDKETELFRAWTLKKGQITKEDKEDFKKEFKINYKGMEIALSGFTVMKQKETDKFVFGYKMKHEDKTMIYYCEDDEENKPLIEVMKMFCSAMGYNLVSMKETLESVWQEYYNRSKE